MICSVKYQSPAGLLTIASRNGRIIGLWIQGQKYYMGNLKEPITWISPDECSCTAQIGSLQPELSRSELSQSGLSQPKLPQSELSQPELSRSELSLSELPQSELSRPELSFSCSADLAVLSRACSWLDRYFAGEKPSPRELPLAPEGSEFRRNVWDILCRIPYGETVTYGEIARQLAAAQTGPTTAACDGTGASGRSLSAAKSVSAQAVGGAVGHNPISIIIPCHRVMGAGGNLTGYAGGIAVKRLLLELEGVDTSGFFIPKRGTAL